MAVKAVLSVLSVLLFSQLASAATPRLKDDAWVAYLNGTNVAGLGITTLDGAAIKGAAKGAAYFTLTDFGKNSTGWVVDTVEEFANPASIKLFYYAADKAANPPKLFDLTTDFSDSTPYGEFKVDKLNAALQAIGVAPVGGATPLLTLIQGKNLLAAWINKNNEAIVGLVTDDPNPGPITDDEESLTYTAEINNETKIFGAPRFFGGNATLDIEDNGDGTYSYIFFTDLVKGPKNETILFPNYLRLVSVYYSNGYDIAIPVFTFPLRGQHWLQAAGEIGLEGTFSQNALVKKLKKAKYGRGPRFTLYAALSVSDIDREYINYAPFQDQFVIDLSEEETP